MHQTQRAGMFSLFTVHAQNLVPLTPAERANPTTVPKTRRPLSATSSVAVLQDPNTEVGAKIDAIDQLTTSNPTQLKTTLATVTSVEPMTVTLLDLARHSDKELASKAKAVLQRMDIDAYVAASLTSPEATTRTAAQTALAHTDKPDAEQILQRTSDPLLANRLRATTKHMTLQPTGTAQGDRYYVKATWNPQDKTAVQCLTILFNKELFNNRTLAQEATIMQQRNFRLVYWDSKEWAIDIANQIECCGGAVTFTHP
jgi:hypothetical protein